MLLKLCSIPSWVFTGWRNVIYRYCYKTCKKKDLTIVCFFISVKKLRFVGNGNTIHEKSGRENLRSQVKVEFVCGPDNPVGMQCATQVQIYILFSIFFSICIRTTFKLSDIYPVTHDASIKLCTDNNFEPFVSAIRK